ncbi:BRCT domain-containing protein [Desulfoluna sp.]|uniref:BRCT domain-containing protein n=1 Tax=Desulfoluna sp. TaxID=2045199 RepID=UPI00261F1FF8|nr:BRCT domain-containing protein [Desulfoluna sp.]
MNDIERLVEELTQLNEAYRRGEPLVSDTDYDEKVETLRALNPAHPYLKAVEPETFNGRGKVRHPVPMLSTEKAYKIEDLERFVNRVDKAASEIGIESVTYQVMAKLDGLAGRDDGTEFATRGNGFEGYEISNAFAKGVIPLGGRGKGLGEIVMGLSYFNTHLKDHFEHPRNMVVGIITSDVLNDHAKKALEDQAVRFVPYGELKRWTGSGPEMIASMDSIRAEVLEGIDYPVDGLVAEITDETLRAHMGATSHHNRWQIAIKTRGESAVTTVENVIWQVGRTGKVTPVMEVTPVKVSGATIRRVTAHNLERLRSEKVGIGAEIEIIRSGEVIPKLEKVLTPAETVLIPEVCPVCDAPLEEDDKFLLCVNPLCSAKAEQRIIHWFKTLGSADWFGKKTVQKLVEKGYDSLEKIYKLKAMEFQALGFGPVQSENLYNALGISRTTSVEDWRFLAAFGVRSLGKSEARNLLAIFPLADLLNQTGDDILAAEIRGFKEAKCKNIGTGLAQVRETILHMLALSFVIEPTPLTSEINEVEATSPLSGKGVVFTGKMIRGSREEMQEMARKIGAVVQSSVTGKTDYLVCGDNVGAKKIEKAQEKGVAAIDENRFYELVES